MADPVAPYVFPKEMSVQDAESILAQAYAAVDDGKVLRLAHKILRRNDIDPPTDVQYVAEPHVEATDAGLEVCLHPDILIYDEFPEMEDCVAAFEGALAEQLAKRLEKSVRRWRKANRP